MHGALVKPNLRFLFRHPAHFIAFGGGVGLSPAAPGTFGTLLAIPLFNWIAPQLAPWTFLVVVVGLFWLGVWASSVTGHALGAAGALEATPTPADAFGDTSPDDVAVPVVAHEAAPVESAHGEPLAQYRAEVADGEGMALAPEPATRHTVSRPAPPRQAAADDSIDLGATVLPVLIKSYAPHAVGALVAIALGYVLGRRSRR